VLTYQGRNITAEISHMVVGISYRDVLGGASSEMSIALEDREKRWQGPWRPSEGVVVNLMLGYGGEKLLEAGDFEVDELELSGPPDVMQMRCLGAYITPALRTRESVGYENRTLVDIAAQIALKHGLGMIGAPVYPNVLFRRVTQNRETDLGFLRRIALAHDYDFTVRGRKLVFYSRYELESRAAVTRLMRRDVATFAFRARTYRTYLAAEVAYLNAETKGLVAFSAKAASAVATGDSVKVIARVEDAQQAALKAAAALHEANMKQVTAVIGLPGATRLVAGNNVEVAGFGEMDGKYLIEIARHRLERRTGYTTEIEARRVR
ncbi:MAG: phage late control D family protein, partial [Candidatus Binataceae bacterium]